MQSDATEEFEESSKIIHSSEGLQEKMAKDGYVFIRDLIDRKKVDLVTNEIVDVLKEYDYVDKDSKEPKWTGKEYDEKNLVQILTSENCEVGKKVSKLRSLERVFASEELMSVLEKILGGEVYIWADKYERVRVMLPGKGTIKLTSGQEAPRHTAAHQDLFVNRMKDKGDVQFLTVWIPLMDVDESVGGLGLMKNSHKGGLYKHYLHNSRTVYVPLNGSDRKEWENKGAISVDGTDLTTGNETWLRSDFHPGDVLIFHRKLLHRGMTNTSNIIRFSGDYRYQRKDTPREWQSGQTLAMSSKFRFEVRSKIIAAGIKNYALIDKLAHEIVLQGPSEEETLENRIKSLAKELA